ncbi:molybdate ABC transporter substrate-binding protein [uncultured Marinobacter sp.]|uniref:molybdate ABC transporter substrate-binding protein n=1 Tax=uncultured Marinobacter sp. TaxID=187379 RepID=UPI0030DD0F41
MAFWGFPGRTLLTVLALLLSYPLQASEPLRIAAASDLRYALDDIVNSYRDAHADANIEVIYGSSGKMTTQIINGAPYDLFFSADIAFPERLHEEGLTATEPAVYALGRIVIWSTTLDAAGLTFDDLATDSIRRIAIAQPAHAPYGMRAKEALQAAGVWDALQGKLVFGENIAHTAQMVSSGAAQAGIIALSLARFPDLAKHNHYLIDEALHRPLTQGYVVTRRGGNKPEALAFADFMTTEDAHAIMIRYGFEMPE